MITIDVRSNTREVLASLSMARENVTKAQARALNRTAEQLRTEAGRELRKEYNVTLRGIRQASRVKRASPRSKYPRAEVTFSGRPINLAEFAARAVNPWNVPGRRHKKRGGGVTVQIKVRGGRKLVEGAFLATIRSGQNIGKRGVFRRTGAGRMPIKFLPSLSIPKMTETRTSSTVLLRFADTRYKVNLSHELRFLMRKT